MERGALLKVFSVGWKVCMAASEDHSGFSSGNNTVTVVQTKIIIQEI